MKWPVKWLSRYYYLIDWADFSPREAKEIVEREMAAERRAVA